MTCSEAREAIVETFGEPRTAEQRLALEGHIASCLDCEQSAKEQRQLDMLLASALTAPDVSRAFRASLQSRIRRDSPWPEFLPDLAHVIGCGAGLAALVLALPEYSRFLLPAGAVFTGVTFFVQALLRDSFEAST